MIFDTVMAGARVYTGEGPPIDADVAIAGESIAAVGHASDWAAAERIEATGLVLCPGFIDLHAHSGLHVLGDPMLTPKVAQGFTTELINPDGLGPSPVDPDAWPERRASLCPIEGPGPERAPWHTIGEYLAVLAEARPATNLVACVPHSAVREHVVGRDDRPPSARELAAMRTEVRLGLEAGARALSFGLIYPPGLFAEPSELVALAEVAASFGAPLVPHVRNEGAGVLDAVGEMIEVARRSGGKLNVSHLKVIGNARLVDDLLLLIDEAARDVDISFDQYPYGAGSTTLAAILPRWALAGGRTAILARLASRDDRRQIADDIRTGLDGWENIYGSCGPERIVVIDAPPSHASLVGRTLAEIGDERSVDPLEAALDDLCETGLALTMIDHYASDDVVRTIFRHPRALVGSDGIFGPHPHPRLYGTAARVLGRLAIRERLISIEGAVARLTARPADLLGLGDRGQIRVGRRADLVLLDPEAYVDTATYEDPMQSPPGVRAVFVNGVAVVRDGRPTGARPGRVERSARGSPAAVG